MDERKPSKYQEQKFKELNAALEEKTVNLIREAETVFRGQNNLFSDDGTVAIATTSPTYHQNESSKSLEKADTGRSGRHSNSSTSYEGKVKNGRVRSAPSQGRKQHQQIERSMLKKKNRPSSSQPKKNNNQEESPFLTSSSNLIKERAILADHIDRLELEAQDDHYTPTELNKDALPDVMDDVGTDATIRFLKAKVRVLQEELDNVSSVSKEKSAKIASLLEKLKEKSSVENALVKKNESLSKIIEKHKISHGELVKHKEDLETNEKVLKRELEQLKREKKQSSAGKNSLEVRLNRALEEMDKQKQALQKSQESVKATNDSDKKRVELLQVENKRLEKQRNELMTAFKKQLKLIDILKRQKTHLEAAKLLEFSEEEFMRTLNWGHP